MRLSNSSSSFFKKTAVILSTVLWTSILLSAESGMRVVPKPWKTEIGQGVFGLSRKTIITIPSEFLLETARQCSLGISRRIGLAIPIRMIPAGKIPKNTVALSLDPADSALGTEGYRLSVTPSGIAVRAADEAGAFYGIQTLFQLVPLGTGNQVKSFPVPCVRIEDRPRFSWRGLHLDVSRHFFPIPFIKT